MAHSLYTLYRNIYSLTLVSLVSIFLATPETHAYTEYELTKIATLVADSPNLRQSLPRLKEKAKEKDANARLLYGKALISTKQIDEGLSVLKTINTDIEPRALVLMAKAYDLKKEHAEEARVLELLKKSHPFSEYVMTSLAAAYFKAKLAPKSIEVLRELIKKQPKRKPAYFQLLDVFESTKNTYEIRILLDDMKTNFPKDAEVHARHCKYYSVGGFLEDADNSCSKAISLNPNFAENHVYLGITKKNLKETEQAEKIIKKAAQQFPKSELAQYTAGQLSDESKNWEMSARYYKTCVTHHPDSDRCQHYLAKSAFEIAQYDVALKAYSISCQKDPQARNDFRNAITFLRNKLKTELADEFNKKYERCGFAD